jgi:hypothetical protein
MEASSTSLHPFPLSSQVKVSLCAQDKIMHSCSPTLLRHTPKPDQQNTVTMESTEAAEAERHRQASPLYSVDLQYIKALFLRKQYRQCITECRQALTAINNDQPWNPARDLFVQFYLGLAHDELARALHDHSQLKLPTFDKAEQSYRQAIRALPSASDCRQAFEHSADKQELLLTSDFQPFQSARSRQTTSSRNDPFVPSSPPEVIIGVQEDGPHAQADAYDSEMDDFENEIVPNHKAVQRNFSRMSLLGNQALLRDYSSMSLLDVRPKLVKSISQGLLRPIRPGSPPKQYHLPPKLPYIGRYHHTPGNSPNLPAIETPESPTRRSRSRLASYEVSPVSPIGSEGITSELTAVSPLSLPTRAPDDLPSPQSDTYLSEPEFSQLEDHLTAMYTQLQTHIRLLQHAKLSTTIAQAERAARSAPTTGTPLGSVGNRSGVFNARSPAGSLKGTPKGSLAQSRSFWSFTPVDVKVADKQKRLEAGRARKWQRERFRPEKYQDLAEKALAEL